MVEHVDIMFTQKLVSAFRSEKDRLINVEKKQLKGVARTLYLEKKVKLSKDSELASSHKGLGMTKMKKVEKESEK